MGAKFEISVAPLSEKEGKICVLVDGQPWSAENWYDLPFTLLHNWVLGALAPPSKLRQENYFMDGPYLFITTYDGQVVSLEFQIDGRPRQASQLPPLLSLSHREYRVAVLDVCHRAIKAVEEKQLGDRLAPKFLADVSPLQARIQHSGT